MKNVRWGSSTMLAAIALAFSGCDGCGGSSTATKDAAGAKLDTGSVSADSGGAVSDTGGASSLDSGLRDLVAAEAGVRDGSVERAIPTEAGVALDLAGADVPATPDAPADLPASGQDSATPGDGPAAGCPLGYHDGGNGTCVVDGTCSAGFHNSGTGACVVSGCAVGYHDGGDGTCRLVGVCVVGYHDDGTGACVASGCAVSYHDGGDGACVPTGMCSVSYHNNGDGVCVRAACASGFHDGGDGTCVASGSCVTGYHDGGDGTCAASGSCMTGYHNGGNGSCVANGSCVTGYHNGGDGSCVTIGTCVTGYHDDGTGTCVMNATGGTGPGGGGSGTGGSTGTGTGTGTSTGPDAGAVVGAAGDGGVDASAGGPDVPVTTDSAMGSGDAGADTISNGDASAGDETPPSCLGLAATCGPSGDAGCCTTLLVPGGTFERSYDDVDYLDPNYPATVNDFYLDKYEITVGRFRQFVNAGMGTQESPPAPGAGAHPLIPGSGWDSTWNTNLPTDTDALKAAMKCYSAYWTWTDTPGSNESMPADCLDWYTAFAFCAWDGGRLPTEAEWNYAASGGSEQRYYPWSSPATSATVDDSYAVYCGGSCNATQNVGSKSPEGDGKWGQCDLAGNVWEWTLDWYAIPYSSSCDNCAQLTAAASSRVIRGGSEGYDASRLRSADRGGLAPESGATDIGVRCARPAPCVEGTTLCSGNRTNSVLTCTNGRWSAPVACGTHQICVGSGGTAQCQCTVDPYCGSKPLGIAPAPRCGTCSTDAQGCSYESSTTCTGGLVCERYAPPVCADPNWAEWPLPNSQADFNAGAPNLESYTDNNDGTVTDNVTGLMWQQAVAPGTYEWDEAVDYCSTTLTLAGHSDWRLPSLIELLSIVDYGQASAPFIDSTAFPWTPADWFWSSSPLAGSSSGAWGVAFYGNFAGSNGVSGAGDVRCVR